jgi:hypothetical protein
MKTPITLRLRQGKGIYWNNDSQFAHELIDDTLRLKKVKESIGDYFNRLELKSVGKQGVLRRHSLCIFDIEYIGKESNYLLESDVEEGDSSQLEDMSAIPAFRTKFNPKILAMLQDIGLDEIAEQCGTNRRALLRTLKGIREFSAGRIMAHIRKCLAYNASTDALSISKEIREVNYLEKETNETLAQLHKVYASFRAQAFQDNNKLTKMYVDGKLTDDEHKAQTRVPIVTMAEAMELLPGEPQLLSTISDVNRLLGGLFLVDELREFISGGGRSMKFYDGEEMFIPYDAFKAKLNLISGVTEYKAKVENFVRDKTMLRKSIEFRRKENRNRLERKTNYQSENIKELVQPIAAEINRLREPYKDMRIALNLMQLFCLAFIWFTIKSSKDIEIALKKAIRTPKQSAISAVGTFNDTLMERLTVKKEARKEKQRQLLATRRAVKKANDPFNRFINQTLRNSGGVDNCPT